MASSLLLDEYLEAADERFLDELCRFEGEKKLALLAPRWYGDQRPAARKLLLDYIDEGCDRPHHRVLVKRLFKLAEERGDDEVMGHFLCAFDRLTRHQIVKKTRWMLGEEAVVQVMVHADRLYDHSPKNPPSKTERDPVTGQLLSRSGQIPIHDHDRFSRHTRRYLARRAFRYFRVIGRKDKPRYGRAIRAALALYSDEHLHRPEQLLDAWGLVHALYWASPVLLRLPLGVRVAPALLLSQLAPAPIYPEAWTGCLDELLQLLRMSKSRTVRRFAIAMLEQNHAAELRGVPVEELIPLLRSPHEELQNFAAQRLGTATGLAKVSLTTWFELLRIESPLALPLVCKLFAETVSPERVTLEQCVDLACLKLAPVAELGLAWARAKWASLSGRGPALTIEEGRKVLLKLANAQADVTRGPAVEWLLEQMGKWDGLPVEWVRDLVDNREGDVRAPALAFVDRDARFTKHRDLWSAFFESPYGDVRAHLLRNLDKAREDGGGGRESMQHLWATSLLAIHRGARDKGVVTRQIADRLIQKPAEADSLLPLLGIALRSLRPPERRAALAAVSRAAFARPSLREAIARRLPDLKLFDADNPAALPSPPAPTAPEVAR